MLLQQPLHYSLHLRINSLVIQISLAYLLLHSGLSVTKAIRFGAKKTLQGQFFPRSIDLRCLCKTVSTLNVDNVLKKLIRWMILLLLLNHPVTFNVKWSVWKPGFSDWYVCWRRGTTWAFSWSRFEQFCIVDIAMFFQTQYVSDWIWFILSCFLFGFHLLSFTSMFSCRTFFRFIDLCFVLDLRYWNGPKTVTILCLKFMVGEEFFVPKEVSLCHTWVLE
jgi:hypothetical protein